MVYLGDSEMVDYLHVVAAVSLNKERESRRFSLTLNLVHIDVLTRLWADLHEDGFAVERD